MPYTFHMLFLPLSPSLSCLSVLRTKHCNNCWCRQPDNTILLSLKKITLQHKPFTENGQNRQSYLSVYDFIRSDGRTRFDKANSVSRCGPRCLLDRCPWQHNALHHHPGQTESTPADGIRKLIVFLGMWQLFLDAFIRFSFLWRGCYFLCIFLDGFLQF